MRSIFFKNKIASVKKQKGFTLLELIVSISIFAFMTAFLVAKYGSFNQSILLTNLAYDVAITIRSAQTFGLNVQGTTAGGGATSFTYPYGVHFEKGSSQFILYTDLGTSVSCAMVGVNSICAYDPGNANEVVNAYKMRPGNTISDICVVVAPSVTCDTSAFSGSLDIVFKRPKPEAIILNNGATASYAEITLQSSDGSKKKVLLRGTGQVAVQN